LQDIVQIVLGGGVSNAEGHSSRGCGGVLAMPPGVLVQLRFTFRVRGIISMALSSRDIRIGEFTAGMDWPKMRAGGAS
jgi:hypothetical protein